MSARRTARRPSSILARPAALLLAAVIAGGLLLADAVHSCGKADARNSVRLEGNILGVVTDPTLPEQIIHYKAFTVSFNPRLHIPNWVSWKITADKATGTEPRADNFRNDPDVKASAQTRDYTRSGYDRGHMAPAGDMKWDPVAMDESFFMTNIAPQRSDLNRGAWQKLEQKCRDRALRDSVVYIVSGPVLSTPDAIIDFIGQTPVAVPRLYFKVILSPYADPPRGIGFIMPNDYVRGGMQATAVTIDSVETLTGHDFFSALPDSLENILESQCNFTPWSQLR